MSSLSFKTQLFVFVRKDSEEVQLRALYSIAKDSTDTDETGAQRLLRDGTQFSRDQPHKYESNADSQQVKSMPFSADDILISSSWDEARSCQFGFAAAQAKSVSLAVSLGINSSLWLLGRRDFCSGSEYSSSNRVRPSILMMRYYIDQIFHSLSRPECDVSFKRESFSVCMKCYEVFGDQIRDLMALSSIGDSSRSSKDVQPVRVREHPVNGAFVSGLIQKVFYSTSEAVEAALAAYEQRLILLSTESVDKSTVSIKQSGGPRPHQVIGTVGNVVLVLEIEQELVSVATKDDYTLGEREQNVVQRSATVQFNFLCEMEPICFKPSKNETTSVLSLQEVKRTVNEGSPTECATVLLPNEIVPVPVQVSQLAVCAKSMASLSRVVTMIQQNTALTNSNTDLSAAMESSQFTHIPYRESTLTRVLQPMLEGKYVNYMHCCLDERAELEGATLATAAYALRLATDLRAGVRSRVVLNERLSKRVTPNSAAMTNEDTRQFVSQAAEIAKEITSNTSQLALEEVKRAIDRVVQVRMETVSHQAEKGTDDHDAENGHRNAFWDLLQSMNADGGMDFADLEKLQQERARLLESLKEMTQRADNILVSRVNGCNEDVDDLQDSEGGSVNTVEVINTQGDDQSKAIPNTSAQTNLHVASNSRDAMNSAAPSSPFSSSSLSTPPRASPGGNSLASVRRSPHSEKLSPLSGSRPASSSAMLTGAHELPALPTLLSPLSAELSRSSLTPRSLKDVQKLTPSPIALELSVSVRSDPMHGGDSTKNVNTHSAGADGTVSPEKLERTMRSQSVKGSRIPSVLSPVQAPLRRSRTGRALPAKTVQTSVAGITYAGVMGTPPRAASQLSLSGMPSSKVVSAKGSSKVLNVPFPSSEGVRNPVARTPVAQLGPVLVAGRVSINAVGLKTFVQLEAADDDLVPKATNAVSTNSDPNDVVARSPSVLPQLINLSHLEEVPPNADPERQGSYPNDLVHDLVGGDTSVSTGVGTVASLVVEDDIAQEGADMHSSVDSNPVTPRTREQELSPLSNILAPKVHSNTTQSTAQSINRFPVMADLPSTRAMSVGSLSSAQQPVASIAAPSAIPLPLSSSPTPSTSSSSANKTRRTLPSERAELSPAHEDAAGAHLSELEVQFLRAVSHTVPAEVASCIRMGVNIKVKNSFGRDAMQIAARNGSTQVMSLIHEHGGEISIRGPKGDTLYHLAASNGHVNVLTWLTEHVYRGAGIAGDAVDMFGQTAAHVAARRGEVTVLRYLHGELGVDVLQEDFDGRTPLEVIPKLFLSGNAEGLVEAKEFLTSVIDLK